MKSLPSRVALDRRWLLCRVGERLCALPLAPVKETMRPLPVTPFAGMPSGVRGVAVIRGVPTPVVDVAALFGGAPEPAVGRFVTLNVGGRAVALAVEAVIGVRELSAAALIDLPPLLAAAGAEGLAALGTLDAELLLVLEEASWVPEELWRAVDRELPAP